MIPLIPHFKKQFVYTWMLLKSELWIIYLDSRYIMWVFHAEDFVCDQLLGIIVYCLLFIV